MELTKTGSNMPEQQSPSEQPKRRGRPPRVLDEVMAPNVIESEKDRKKKWLNETVKVEFFNLEEPGVPLKFTFGNTKTNKTYTLLHGGKYDLRREVVQHIESRQTPIWGYKPDGHGRMQKSLEGYKSRFQCRQVFE